MNLRFLLKHVFFFFAKTCFSAKIVMLTLFSSLMCVFRVVDVFACNPPGDVTTGTYGNFSETQTESQVITLIYLIRRRVTLNPCLLERVNRVCNLSTSILI